ncbi:MAG: CapA family protein [Clostridia bacterium]|nr:CapA family protein [Clostridia bacterium]
MKKILFIIMIILFIIGMRHTVLKEYDHTDNSAPASTENNENSASDSVQPDLLNSSVKITAVGDCTLATDINGAGAGSFVSEVLAQNDNYSYFLKNVRQYFENDDLTIVNLEGTLSENGTRADKQFAFRGKPEYVKILSDSSVEAANLANNHTHDYGSIAFSDTKLHLSDNGIACFEGLDVAMLEKNGIKIGLIGINALNDTHRSYLDKAMERAKAENPDLIIVSFHWGIEKASSPTDLQVSLAHKAIDNGADLVIGHHPHVLQGIEKYKDKYILYSLGNFCFGGNRNSSDKDTMIFKQEFTFRDGALVIDDNISIIPCSISSVTSRNNYQPTPLTGAARDRVIKKITGYTESLGNAVLNFE